MLNTGDGLKTLDAVRRRRTTAIDPTSTRSSRRCTAADPPSHRRPRGLPWPSRSASRPSCAPTPAARPRSPSSRPSRPCRVIAALEADAPRASRARVLDDAGALRRFVNVYVGDEDVRFADGLATAVADGAQVSIIPAVAGG